MAPLEHAIPPMATVMIKDPADVDEKADYEHIQHMSEKLEAVDQLPVTIPTSAYSTLTPWQAIRKFRRQFLFGCAACLGAL